MVPTQTEFAHALAQPYSAIHSIINRRKVNPQSPSEPTDADVVSHFRELFSDQDCTSKTEARLVRWRCMIQDTGFATEVYQSYQLEDLSSVPQASSSSSQTTATPSALYSAFGLDFSLSATASASEADMAVSTPFRANDWQDLGFAMPQGSNPSASTSSSTASTAYHGLCLHVLFFTPLPSSTIPQALTEARTPSLWGMVSAPEIRAQLIAYLKETLGAKEKPLPAAEGTTTVIPPTPLPKLSQAFRTLLPAVVDQSLALHHLNSREVKFAPRAGNGSSSSDTGETLKAGRLQLPKGTLLLVDEVGMGDGGQLNEGGVRNLQTLSGVLRTHRLEYEYPYNRFAFETDLRVVVLSAGKSFLPVDVFLPLE
ncbi:hypothetical protein CF326_g7729, partial [Tilletia indica]